MPKKILPALLLVSFALPVVAADYTITAANVAATASTTTIKNVRAGETVTAGMPVYRNTSDGEYYKCDADASEAAATCAGIAISAGVDGSYITIVTAGRMDLGTTLAIGTQVFVSDTAGGLMPGADLDTGDYITPVGVVVAADEIIVGIVVTGEQK